MAPAAMSQLRQGLTLDLTFRDGNPGVGRLEELNTSYKFHSVE